MQQQKEREYLKFKNAPLTVTGQTKQPSEYQDTNSVVRASSGANLIENAERAGKDRGLYTSLGITLANDQIM